MTAACCCGVNFLPGAPPRRRIVCCWVSSWHAIAEAVANPPKEVPAKATTPTSNLQGDAPRPHILPPSDCYQPGSASLDCRVAYSEVGGRRLV
eukprot:31833_5